MSAFRLDELSNVVDFPFNHDEEASDVERINQFSFYTLGRTLQRLASHSGDVAPRRIVFDLFEVLNTLDALLKGDPIPLGLSRGPAVKLRAQVDEVFKQYCAGDPDASPPSRMLWQDEKAPPIPGWQLEYLGTLQSAFETVFSEEMREATTYFVPRKGIFSTPALVDAAHESFPPEVRSHIPSKTVEDWKSAGRCLAFNLLSASGFHVARAVEGTMEKYYQLFSGKAGKTLKSWNEYVKELEKLAKDNEPPSGKVFAEIKQMKDDFRNPLMHPRVTLTESDARVLFNNGESLIIAMAQEIGDAQKGQNALLALVAPDPESEVI